MPPTRPLYWNIDFVWLFYLLAAVAIISFAYGMARRVVVWRIKSLEGGFPKIDLSRVDDLFRDGLLGVRIFRGDLAAGMMHLLIAWGFIGLFIGTTMVAIHEYIIEFLHGAVYLFFSATLEICGLMFLIGLLWAGIRRYLQRVERLTRGLGDLVPFLWLLVIGLSGFFVEGARLAAQNPTWGEWSFAGWTLTALPLTQGQFEGAYVALWWGHAIVSLGFIAWLPHGKLLHTLTAPLHLLIDVTPTRIGADDRSDEGDDDDVQASPPLFPGRHLLSFDACTRCGRCSEVCPSCAASEPLSPREVVLDLRAAPALASPLGAGSSKGEGAPTLIDAFKAAGGTWYCTSCMACREVCPVEISPLEIISHVRGALVEEGSTVPPKLGEVLERVYKYQNPWLAKKGQKVGWSKGSKKLESIDIPDLSKKPKKSEEGPAAEWLYFVGCTTSLDTRAQSMARSLALVLDRCGVSFGTLGKKEPCCGDIGRRVGEQGLFEEQRDATMKLLEKRSLTKIVTSSPHCFDAMANSYPGSLEVSHYTQLLASLVEKGLLQFVKNLELKVTFHDPCYLGRHNGLFYSPRRVIRALPGVELIEMEQHGPLSLCCGGGGGRIFQEMPEGGDMAGRRVRQAAATGAEVLITACPLCLIMLEDARKTSGLEDKIEVRDLNELVAEAMGLLEPNEEHDE